MKKLFFVLAIGAFAVSCKKESDKNIFKGPEVQVYQGKAWTSVQLSKEGNPERLAISITDAALNSVPGDDGSGGGHNHSNNFVVKFHSKAAATPFKHVWLNWNPSGHPPVNIYTKPHFDLHFYMVESEVRDGFVDQAKLDASPAADYVPVNHLGVDPIPTMGKHFVDLTSPELNPTNPQPFSQTFIYGSYDSKVVFYEPMITLEFLKNTANFERAIPQPAKVQESGYYPTKMRVVKHDKITEIVLDSMVYRQAS